MRRRQVLAGGTALLVAGCTGGSDDDGFATTTTAEEDTSTAAESAAAATFDVEAVQPGIVVAEEDSIAVRADAGQYVLVGVSGADGVAPDAFTLTVGAEDYGPVDVDRPLFRGAEPAPSYSAAEGFGLLVFGLPEALVAADAALSGSTTETDLSDRTRRRLETPSPPVEVAFDAPAEVKEDDLPKLTVSARNVGDVAGNCVLALNRVGPDVASTPVREVVCDLDPGETVTAEYDATSPFYTDTEPEEVTYHLESARGDQLSRTIEPAE